MINSFMDEVAASGGEAVLPGNLDQKWFDILYPASVHFLRKHFFSDVSAAQKTPSTAEEDATTTFDEVSSALLVAAVNELIQALNDYNPNTDFTDLSKEEVHNCICCYAMNVIYHAIASETKIDILPATIETVFDSERLFEIESSFPAMTTLLLTIIHNGPAADDDNSNPGPQ